MKSIMKSTYLKVYFTITALAIALFGMAQEKKLDIDIGINKEPVWYMQPWVWVLAGAIFILLLAAILRGGRSKA